MGKLTGTVKWFNTSKGYGFIVPDESRKDIFVHISDVQKSGLSTLQEGDKVEYDVAEERGKPKATNLRKTA